MKRRGVLAIDPGTVRSGLAAADPTGIATRPLAPAEGGPEGLIERVEALVRERDVGTIVVGLPLHMDGSEGRRAAASRALAGRLRARFPEIAVELQDERLSSKEAEELMRSARVPRAERRAWADSYSALVILRDWLGA